MASQEIRDALAGDPAVRARSIGVRRLRHIGNMRVYRLRPGPGWLPTHGTGP
jgi:hypothetical protein